MASSSPGSRSRFGCITCRRKRRKCDEQRPVCKLCQSSGLECSYRSTVKWADSHNVSTFSASLQQKGKPARRLANSAARRDLTSGPPPGQVSQNVGSKRPRTHELMDLLPHGPDGPPRQYTKQGDLASPPSFIEDEITAASTTQDSRLISFDEPQCAAPLTNATCRPELRRTRSLQNNQGPDELLAGRCDPGNGHERWEESDDGDDAPRDDWAGYDPSGDDRLTAANQGTWVADNPMSCLLFQTSLAPGEDIAFMYYFNRVSTCIPAYDSDSNPYRKLALISLSHPVLLHGILSVSTAHMHNYGRSNDTILSTRQARALKSLRAALGALLVHKGEGATATVEMRPFVDTTGIFSLLSARELAFAAIMMQTSSVLMTGIGSVEVHIKCALEFIRDLGCLYQPAQSMFGRLLIHRFSMVDIVLAHFRFRRPLAPVDFFMYRANEQLDQEEPSFREMQGCEQRVLCFLAQIAHLSAELADFPSLNGDIQTKGYELETEMSAWGHRYHSSMARNTGIYAMSSGPPAGSSGSKDDQRKFLDIVCECFYWAAHILLLRRVFLDPTRSTRVQLIRRHIFRLMDSLPVGCGPDSSLPFPFYMAAREAVTGEDREWVRQKHAAMMEEHRDRSREYLMTATERIWEKETNAGSQTSGATRLLDTEYEKFIRETDKQASYFMF